MFFEIFKIFSFTRKVSLGLLKTIIDGRVVGNNELYNNRIFQGIRFTAQCSCRAEEVGYVQAQMDIHNIID